MSNNDKIYRFNKNYKRSSSSRSRKTRTGNTPAAIFVILFSLCLVFAYREMLHNKDPEGNTTDIYHVANSYITGKSTFYGSSESPQERDEIYVLYNSLNDADKQVYNLFLDLVENRNGERYTNGIIISEQQIAQLNPDHFWHIYYSMLYEHPEYFFMLSSPDMIDSHYYIKDNYRIYIYMIKPETEKEAQQVNAFNAAAKEFMKDIDPRLPDDQKELAIHDKLISLVSYDYNLYKRRNAKDAGYDLGFSAYGALVSNSSGNPNRAVCNGYALAFEYLCQKAGIPCCVLSGEAFHIPASPDQDAEGHAWNAVKISGQWFEVDVTWDDREYNESIDWGFFNLLQQDNEKFYNCLHHFYNKTTAEMAYLKATEDTVFYIDGYAPYNFVSDTSHIRDTSFTGTSKDFDVFRNLLVPIAE